MLESDIAKKEKKKEREIWKNYNKMMVIIFGKYQLQSRRFVYIRVYKDNKFR